MAPVALLGLRNEENLFIAEDGSTDAHYIPAFARRCPFELAETGERGIRIAALEIWVTQCPCNTWPVGNLIVDNIQKQVEFKSIGAWQLESDNYGYPYFMVDLICSHPQTYMRSLKEFISGRT